jgi:hypothetical protein
MLSKPVKAERAAAVTYIRQRGKAILSNADRGRISDAEGEHLSRCIDVLAEDIATGLHAGD